MIPSVSMEPPHPILSHEWMDPCRSRGNKYQKTGAAKCDTG